MADDAAVAAATTDTQRRARRPWGFLVAAMIPVVAAAILYYHLDPLDPSPLPLRYDLTRRSLAAPVVEGRMLRGSDLVGAGAVEGPEDLAYEPEEGVIYTGCMDGWIKRVSLKSAAVENWVRVGGRPLGLAFGKHKELIVAHPDEGLLNISRDGGTVEVLTAEAEGVRFGLTDGVAVAADGVVYFTDASSKYGMTEYLYDFLEGRPYGRLLSYDPSTRRTLVLLRHLYFANGVAVTPDQNAVVFCETAMMRCRRYYVRGEKKGTVEGFLDHLPGLPDNIHSDGEGRFWIALFTGMTWFWETACKHPRLRKVIGILERRGLRPAFEGHGGVVAVDAAEGKPLAYFHDAGLAMFTGALKVGDGLYCASLRRPHLFRFNLTHPIPTRADALHG